MLRSFLTMLVLLSALVLCTYNAEAASLADAYRTIHASLVFIRADATTGTGFVVASDAKFSYVVTAEHVVHGAKKISAFANDDYALPFELASILLLAAMVGSVMLGKRETGERNF